VALFENNRLIISGTAGEFRADFVGFGSAVSLIKTHSLTESGVSLCLEDVALSLKLTRLLGVGWLSTRIGEHLVLQHNDNESSMFLKNAAFV